MLSPSIFLSGVWLQAAPALVLEILHQIKTVRSIDDAPPGQV